MSQKKGNIPTRCEVLIYLSQTYDTDNVIAETDAGIGRFNPLPGKKPIEFADLPWNMDMQADLLYDEYVLNPIH